MEFDNDELPPDLVDIDSELPEAEKPVKVPITIVTGLEIYLALDRCRSTS